jgi:hypothetical protein
MISSPRLLFITLLSVALLYACSPPLIIGDGTTYFHDDFSNTTSGWDQTSGKDGATEYTDGQYRMYAALPNYLLWANPQKLFPADVIVDVIASKRAGPDNNAFGILCRYQDAGNYYALVMSSDGHAGIAKVQGGQGPMMISGSQMEPKSAIQKGNAINLLRAECVGKNLKLFVNDSLVAATTDDTFLVNGDAGLWLGSYEDPGTEIFFDDFLVRRP